MSQGTDEEDKNLSSYDPVYNISENGQGWIKLNGPCCGSGEHACMNLNRKCGLPTRRLSREGQGLLALSRAGCDQEILVNNVSSDISS